MKTNPVNSVPSKNAASVFKAVFLLLLGIVFFNSANAQTCFAYFYVSNQNAHTVTLTDGSSSSSGTINHALSSIDFGDGTLLTPLPFSGQYTHTYGPFGNYNVLLTIYDSINSCMDTFANTIIINSNCITYTTTLSSTSSSTGTGASQQYTENLSATINGGTAPYTYAWTFVNTVTGTTTSTLANPSITYMPNEQVTASLIVTDANGCASTYNYLYFLHTYCTLTLTSATATPIAGTVNSYNFLASSTGGGTNLTYLWDVGQNNYHNGNNFNYTYNYNGLMNPFVIAQDTLGCADTLYLTPFTITNANPCAGLAQFSTYNYCWHTIFYSNSGSSNNLTWDFGDGSPTSNASQVNHSYATAGSYTATLIVNNTGLGCSDTSSQVVTITNTTIISAAFSTTVSGNSVTATINNATNVTGLYWSFDDGFTATTPSVTHSFIFGGLHTIFLDVQNGSGCSDSMMGQVFIQLPNQDTIAGKVFNDVNNNGLLDAGENGMPNTALQITDGTTSMYIYTDANGDYSAYVASGTYTVSIAFGLFGWSQTIPVSPATYTITVTSNQLLSGFNFGLINNIPQINGSVYFDTNGNGTRDAGESGVANIAVNIFGNSSSTHVYTDALGNYSYNAYSGAGYYNINCNPPTSGYTGYSVSSTPNQYSINTAGTSIYNNNDFGIHQPSATAGNNLMVTLSPVTTATPGYPCWYMIAVKNIGSTTVGGSVVFTYDAVCTFLSSNNGTNNNTTHQVSWNVNPLIPGATNNEYVYFIMPTTAALNSILNHSATVTAANDVDLSNNTAVLSEVVVGSFDPNHKSVSPVGVGTNGAINTNSSGELTYTIQFQNTGTAPAINIQVKDVISANLDLNSFRMLAASANYTLSVDDNTREVVWKFSSIYLPDSTHDEPHSHGFVTFAIKPLATLSQGNTISNTANIYFDFNAAVQTNTTINTVDFTLDIPTLDETFTFDIHPNPANDFAGIQLIGLSNYNALSLRIMNMNGAIVKEEAITTDYFRINTADFTNGTYIYQVTQANKKVAEGKLIIQH